MSAIRSLCLIDSPTLATGFARVGQNLLPPWVAAGAKVDIWGIGFNGFGYEAWPQFRIFPAGNGANWSSPRALQDFLNHLAAGNYTHLFILQDTFQFKRDFCEMLANVCTQKKIRSLMYFPVDAPLEPEWLEILRTVDCAVAYTEYGRQEVAKCDGGVAAICHVLPHGVDTNIYQPRPDARANDRCMWRLGAKKEVWLKPDDFLLLNVNTNQWRKDCARSLEILAELKRRGVPAKLVMHCRKATHYGTDLEATGRQLGLKLNHDWVHNDYLFGPGDGTFMGYDTAGKPLIGSAVNEPDLARMYNASDCVLSTSLGEGWGFSFTEALACGTPIAIPAHTSCFELYREVTGRVRSPESGVQRFVIVGARSLESYALTQICLLPADDRVVMPGEMSRLRNRVEMPEAADKLEQYYKSGWWRERLPMPEPVKEWLSWPRISEAMFKLLIGDGQPVKAKRKTLEIEI